MLGISPADFPMASIPDQITRRFTEDFMALYFISINSYFI